MTLVYYNGIIVYNDRMDLKTITVEFFYWNTTKIKNFQFTVNAIIYERRV